MADGDLILSLGLLEDDPDRPVTTPVELSPTARRMLETLPIYYHGVPFFERLIQAIANRIDERDRWLDEIQAGMIPHLATVRHGLLDLWEAQLDLPVGPDAPEQQRRDLLDARLRSAGAYTAADILAALAAVMGDRPFTFQRNTPEMLHDLIATEYGDGSLVAGHLQRFAERMWPAHRVLALRYGEGWIADVSRADEGVV